MPPRIPTVDDDLLIRDPVLDDGRIPVIDGGGLIPGPNIGGGTLDPAPEIDISTLPAEYCMRDEYILLAQNQDQHGYCWNFAATMSMATTIMKATGEFYDFSELWTGVSAYICDDGYRKVGAGGSISTQYESIKQSGLMLEMDFPYQDSFTVSNDNAADYYNFYEKYSNDDLVDSLVRDSSTSFSSSNVAAIKKHIYDHGSVYMAFNFRTGWIENGPAYHLTPNQTNTNSSHAVSVIGWDDNYEAEFYLNGSEEPTLFKGAWIILNSYTESNAKDGIAFVFYDDNNISSLNGYRYEPYTEKDLYFYDKIDSGYAYPTSVKGKYCGSFIPTEGTTLQKNIFYDDVELVYSYISSPDTVVEGIEICRGDRKVTEDFTVVIDNAAKRFSISAEGADYGQYKILVTYGNGERSDTYLNNFFVTHGIIGEEIEFDYEANSLGFNTGRELEQHSMVSPEKSYVIYVDKLEGEVAFLQAKQSVYTEQYTSIPTLSYKITNGKSCTVTHTITADTGYELRYNFTFEYCADTSLLPVNVYYDLAGGENHPENYAKELAGEGSELILYAPTREGYTFGGWYLDYGHGSRPLRKDGDKYYVSWEDICHLGEVANMNASSHYQKYYKNSNTVFVYARWEEVPSYSVELSMSGEGSCTVGERITLSSEDTLRYYFIPASGWTLSDVKINGSSVPTDELTEIVKHGLQLKGIDSDKSIEVTFVKGAYLSLILGDNIKNAYLIKSINGEEVRFNIGDAIPYEYIQATLTSNFTLVIEVFDDTEDGTYVLENMSGYGVLDKGVFTKGISIMNKGKIVEREVASAILKPIVDVTVSYSVAGQVLDHYISADRSATSGERDGMASKYGEVLYLFVRCPEPTNTVMYSLPAGFVDVGGGWFRKPVFVNSDAPSLGTVTATPATRTYTVTWKNWDDSVIYSEKYTYQEFPTYNYRGYPALIGGSYIYPTRAEDERFTYEFAGWSPDIKKVTADTTYTAVFIAVPKQYTVKVSECENGVVTPSGDNTINCLDRHTYLITPNEGYRIKDVLVNGTSVGAVTSYTFADVACDQTLSVEFERIKHSVSLISTKGGRVDSEVPAELYYGDELTLTFTPDVGYAVDMVLVNGKAVDLSENGLSITIGADTAVTVVFERVNDIPLLVTTIATIVFSAIATTAIAFVRLKRREED